MATGGARRPHAGAFGCGLCPENRVPPRAPSRAVFARQTIHRLGGFFREFRDALLDLRQEKMPCRDPHAGTLERDLLQHAYIARYLASRWLQGEDLTVEQGRLMVRTVSGLRPLDVLWRRLDGSYARSAGA